MLVGSQCAQGNIIEAQDCEARVSHSSQSTGDCSRLLIPYFVTDFESAVFREMNVL